MKKVILLACAFLTVLSCKHKYSIDEYDSKYGKDSAIVAKSIKTDPIGTGVITSIADGVDVKIVNLWSSTEEDRTIVAQMVKGDNVNILEDADPYYYLELEKNKVKGYCMKGYVTSIKLE
jgi:hypothetical protein